MVFLAPTNFSGRYILVADEDPEVVLSNTKIQGMPGIELIQQLRRDRPAQRLLYLANSGRE